MLEILPIMPALCSMLFNAHYAQNYGSKIGTSLTEMAVSLSSNNDKHNNYTDIIMPADYNASNSILGPFIDQYSLIEQSVYIAILYNGWVELTRFNAIKIL